MRLAVWRSTGRRVAHYSKHQQQQHVFPSFLGDTHELTISKGEKSFQIHMKRLDRTTLMSGFWEHKVLSPTLWALNLQGRRKSTAVSSGSSQPSDPTAPRPPRKMADSYCEIRLPFRTEPKLAEEYASINGGLRVGKLLEDLDVLAASIAYLHCDDLDLTIVTAAVDRIDLLLPIDTIVSDVRMRGSVTYVGRSSIEVTISVETDQEVADSPNTWELAALAKFILVARNPVGNAGVEVNRLQLETGREKEIFERGRERHAYRLRRSEQSLFKQPPEEDEVRLVHSICMAEEKSMDKRLTDPITKDDAQHSLKLIPMDKAHMTSIRICHPQERNIHNFIFGGYLCREAFELAFAAATVFMQGQRPSLKSIDDIAFVHPVPIGSIMDLKAQTIHTRIHDDLLYVCIQVVADIINPSTDTRLTTNTFHFTLTHPTSAFPSGVPMVQPRTYIEAMQYLEGKRRVDFDLETAMTPLTRQSYHQNPPHFDPSLDEKSSEQ